jgi:hypothetical protein
MTKIYDLLAKQNGKGINHFRYGYEEIPTAMLTFYDLSDLNNPNFDFRTARVKRTKMETTTFSDAKKIVWYEDSIKEASFTAASTAAAGTVSFDVSISTLTVGDQIRNVTKGISMLVVATSGATITVDANTAGVTSGDIIMRYGFAKKYGVSHTRTSDLNDLSTNENYVQFVAESLPADKTDVLTNNLNMLLYKDANEYISDLFAQSSRSILKTMVYALYIGKPAVTSVGGKNIYECGGLEYFIPSAYKNVNVKGGTDKATIGNIRTQLRKAYQSGVDGLYKAGRIVLFVNSEMNNKLDDMFFDKITQLDNNLSNFGINVRRLDLSGYKIDIVEDAILNELYGSTAVAYLVDLQSIYMYNLEKGVIADSGKTVEAFGASKIFVPAQTTPEAKEIQLHTSFSYVLGNIGSGVFQKWIYA